ncbi:hypothetical protein HPB48_001649 [Haemaphysalis longicornis]|uniref:MULE transposase domain-containing protein n=1 Tax=Haemaphysalis longicornis TaxID=44386 RepID=A0A9J6FWU2_HAELO|nr:hypothetical protein HPB48_001649 [Haemaphysalis longicornis]
MSCSPEGCCPCCIAYSDGKPWHLIRGSFAHLTLGARAVTRHLLTDFEQAAIQEFRAVFPAAAPSACFFHLKQSVQRKVQESGLASLYSQNSRFREAVQLLAALAFLWPEDIGRGKPRNATLLFAMYD